MKDSLTFSLSASAALVLALACAACFADSPGVAGRVAGEAADPAAFFTAADTGGEVTRSPAHSAATYTVQCVGGNCKSARGHKPVAQSAAKSPAPVAVPQRSVSWKPRLFRRR